MLETKEYGTEPHKLHRRDDVDTSIAAAHRIDSSTWEARVYDYVHSCGHDGCTGKDAVRAFPDAPYSTVTARFAALKEKGLVVDTGKRRERAAILVADEFVKQQGELF